MGVENIVCYGTIINFCNAKMSTTIFICVILITESYVKDHLVLS
jgi:hypothetical protein